jgi:hypothetical protein
MKSIVKRIVMHLYCRELISETTVTRLFTIFKLAEA